MNSCQYSPRLLRVARWALAFVFIYSGILKLVEPRRLLELTIARFEMVPAEAIAPLAAILPIYETLAGAWMLTGWRCRAAALALLALTTIFMVALGHAHFHSLAIDCACFGGHGPSVSLETAILRDAVLLALSAVIFASERTARPSVARPFFCEKSTGGVPPR